MLLRILNLAIFILIQNLWLQSWGGILAFEVSSHTAFFRSSYLKPLKKKCSHSWWLFSPIFRCYQSSLINQRRRKLVCQLQETKERGEEREPSKSRILCSHFDSLLPAVCVSPFRAVLEEEANRFVTSQKRWQHRSLKDSILQHSRKHVKNKLGNWFRYIDIIIFRCDKCFQPKYLLLIVLTFHLGFWLSYEQSVLQ